MRLLLKNGFYIFAVLGLILIPASTTLFSFQDEIAVFLFHDLAKSFHLTPNQFSSDSLGLYWMLLVVFIFSILISFILSKIKLWQEHQQKIIALFGLLIVYYLASRMFVYGFDKVFKSQFYLPEPNTLYTPLGYLTKDILFWSVMGTSKWYCIITGLFELIPAVLMLFNRTRIVGLILTFFVLLNVLAINFSFDISVKLYSLFLLFLCLLLIWPKLKTILHFFEGKRVQMSPATKSFNFLYQPFARTSIKVFVIGLILMEALYLSVSTRNFNDDVAVRPYLHGAYEVSAQEGLVQAPNSIKRFYVHRRGYLIIEYVGGERIDYELEIDSVNQFFVATDYRANVNYFPYKLYVDNEDILDISFGVGKNDSLIWQRGLKLEWRVLPALKDEFHWTIDSYE